jgi:hypothetical protein
LGNLGYGKNLAQRKGEESTSVKDLNLRQLLQLKGITTNTSTVAALGLSKQDLSTVLKNNKGLSTLLSNKLALYLTSTLTLSELTSTLLGD